MTPLDQVPWTRGPWIFREWAQGPEDIARMKEVGMEPNRMLMNDGACPVLSADPESVSPRICLVDCKTPFKRGQGYLTECAERDANARLIAESPTMAALLEELLEYEAEMQGEDWMQKQPVYIKARALLSRIRGAPHE